MFFFREIINLSQYNHEIKYFTESLQLTMRYTYNQTMRYTYNQLYAINIIRPAKAFNKIKHTNKIIRNHK